MERLASVKSARNSSATDSQAQTTYRPIEITKIKASIATVNARPGLPKSPRNGAFSKSNSIFSKGANLKNGKKVEVPRIDLQSLENDARRIDLVESPKNVQTQPMSRNYLQVRGGTGILGSTPRLQVDLDKS